MSEIDKITLSDGSYLYFKDWGGGAADRVQPRLAADGGCV